MILDSHNNSKLVFLSLNNTDYESKLLHSSNNLRVQAISYLENLVIRKIITCSWVRLIIRYYVISDPENISTLSANFGDLAIFVIEHLEL